MSDATNPAGKPTAKDKKEANVSEQKKTKPVFSPEESLLVAHARRELDLAGINDKDSDYGGLLASAALELIGTFAAQGHSGTSAEITTEIFNKLARFETLSPLTTDPDEWQSVSEMSGYPLWQSKRSPAHFSKDGGRTFYNVRNNKTGRSLTPKELENAKKKALETEQKTDK